MNYSEIFLVVTVATVLIRSQATKKKFLLFSKHFYHETLSCLRHQQPLRK